MSREVLDSDVFDVLPDALLVVRGERIVWANMAGLRLLGVAAQHADDLFGRPFEDILAPGERLRLSLLEKQRGAGWALPATCRVRFVRLSDASPVMTDVRFGTRGDLLLMSARDVTDVTRAEALMGTLAQTFARGTALLDADALLDATEPTFEALRWKVAFIEFVPGGSIMRRVLAAPIGDPLGDYGRSLMGVFMPFDKTPVITEAVKKGAPIFLDNIPTAYPGPLARAMALSASMERARVIRSAWCPILSNGRISHLLVVSGRDLTEHDFVGIQLFAAQLGAAINLSALRAALVQKERLAAVGQMAAVMAHEVRNPLGIIFNALSGLRRPSGELAAELLDIIQEEANRLRRLVTDLLDFSRPSAVQIEIVEVAPLLRQAAEAACADPTSGGAGKQIHLDFAPDVSEVETDPMLLRRALVNLLVNGLQNVSVDGRVSLSAKAVGDELYVRVSNDAVPMTPEVAARVFEPFFTTRAAGTGLGLAVVRRILEDLGGSVALEGATASNGTTFSLRLPLRSAAISRPIG